MVIRVSLSTNQKNLDQKNLAPFVWGYLSTSSTLLYCGCVDSGNERPKPQCQYAPRFRHAEQASCGVLILLYNPACMKT
jgi:hypothetical protein